MLTKMLNKINLKNNIEKLFNKMAMKFHPDKNKHEKAEEVFKKISAAYKILSDPEKKRKYDMNPDADIFDA